MCRGMKIPVTATLLKHQLVRLISEAKGEQPPPTSFVQGKYFICTQDYYKNQPSDHI